MTLEACVVRISDIIGYIGRINDTELKEENNNAYYTLIEKPEISKKILAEFGRKRKYLFQRQKK